MSFSPTFDSSIKVKCLTPPEEVKLIVVHKFCLLVRFPLKRDCCQLGEAEAGKFATLPRLSNTWSEVAFQMRVIADLNAGEWN